MFEKKEPQIFNEAYRVSGLNLEWVGMSAILMVFKAKANQIILDDFQTLIEHL